MLRPLARRAAAVAVAVLLSGGPLQAGQALAVVELFTSQGCSSCPPADKLLGDLAKRDDVLALSLPVDYWDYIGWKDTLASPAFSARQRAYAKTRGDRAVYTPQAVINGKLHRVGSDEGQLYQAIDRTNSMRTAVEVDAHEEGGKIVVDVGRGKTAGPASVLMLVYDPAETVAIGRGENAGRTITYHNVVRRMVELGEWTGEPRRFVVEKPGGGRRCAVILQKGTHNTPGLILGAAAM